MRGVVRHSKIGHPCRSWANCTHRRAAALLSASPQLAESIRAAKRFRVVPLADSCIAANRPPSLDHVVGEREHFGWNLKAEGPGSIEIDDQLEFSWLHNRQVGGLLTLENAGRIEPNLTIGVSNVDAVAHQTAGRNKLPKLVHGGHRVARCE